MSDGVRAAIILTSCVLLVVVVRLARRAWGWSRVLGSVERYETWDWDSVESRGPQNPTGRVPVDRHKLALIDPEVAANERAFFGVQASLVRGDGQPAVVVQTVPLIVAAYNDELDVVTFLSFASTRIDATQFQIGQKFACSTMYHSLGGTFARFQLASDLKPGPCDSGNFDNLRPRIIDLVCSDPTVADRVLRGVPQASWKRLQDAAREFIANPNVPLRDGRLTRCHIPAFGNWRWSLRRAIKTFLK